MTEVPYVFVSSEVLIDGKLQQGISADGLPPKWFTKDPKTTFDHDLGEMYRVIRHAAELAQQPKHVSFFEWWQHLYFEQLAWATEHRLSPLLANLGTSLIERSMLDAICRAKNTPFHQLLQSELLEINLGEVRLSLSGVSCRDFLPTKPAKSIYVRHAVGLGDPLCDDDVPTNEKLNDGLPHSLVASIRKYGLRYFKIKLSGNIQQDRERLVRLAELINTEATQAKITLDGNENFNDIAQFKEHWTLYNQDRILRDFLQEDLLFVEQPIHRDFALQETVKETLEKWPDHPPIVIDESDGELSDLPKALELGYAGTSHKNCKGIIKGLANAATLALCQQSGQNVILSAEDLGNVGPVALLQDYAVVAALGIQHVERNGHHYYRGLSMFPQTEQQRTVRCHDDLYQADDSRFGQMKIQSGRVDLASVNSAPFGVAELPDLSQFSLLDEDASLKLK